MNHPAFPSVPRPAGWSAMNDARYAAVIRVVLGIEGGHSNDKADRGGETNHGVSLRFLKAVGQIDANHDGFGDLDLNFDTVLDGQDIRAMTPEIASEVFLGHFYIGPGIWKLAAPYDGAIFDQAVNGGTTAAIKILQRALNRVITVKVAVDAAFGPKTLSAFHSALSRRAALLNAIQHEARLRYEAIVRADPTQKKYLDGWRNRARNLGNV